MAKWQLSGDYFENCNCDVVCPCLVSTQAPMTSRPSQGACEVAIAFHIDRGDYDGVSLDGLNVAVIGRAPGPMAEGNMTLAAYIDERADDRQMAAIEAIFGGSEGGPIAAFAPLVGEHLGARKVPIRYTIDHYLRSGRPGRSDGGPARSVRRQCGACGRRRADPGRRLSADTAEGALPVALPNAADLHHDLLARG